LNSTSSLPNVPSASLHERVAVGRIVETARLHRDHLSARTAHQLDGRRRGLDGDVATDHRRARSGKRQRSRAAQAAARAGDDAYLSRQSA
jgi:hypothetical protein